MHTYQEHITLRGESNVKLKTMDTMGVQMKLVMLKVGHFEKPGKKNQSLLGLERLAIKCLIMIK